MPKVPHCELARRFQAALLGVAAGDALGATLEFLSPDEVSRRYGVLKEIVGGGWLELQPGAVTDDTDMTLAVAHGILENPADPVPPVGRRFVAWLQSQPKDVGNTCQIAISAAGAAGDWGRAVLTVERELGDYAAGNGSLMRTLPVALAYYGDDAKVVEMAARISRMTHPPRVATAACQAYCLLVCRLLDGHPKEDALHWLLTRGDALLELPDEVRTALAVAASAPAPEASGYVVDSLRAAMWAFMGSVNAEECIVRAANLGDDADTVAAIAGGLAGTYYGEIPERWVRVLAVREELEQVAERLAALHRC